MEAIIIHGPAVSALDGQDRTAAPRKLDTITLPYITDREDTFDHGGPIPGYAFVEIEEVTTRVLAPGQRYLHTLRGKGLLRPGHKLESSSLKQPEEGWDEGPQTWLTTNPGAFSIGSVHPSEPNLWCVGIEDKEQITDKVWRITPTYKGIILTGGQPKPATWKITVNGETITTSGNVTLGSVTPQIFTDEDGVWNGWATGRKARFDFSKINLVKTCLSTVAPRTDRVGLSLTPDIGTMPAMFNIFDDSRWFATGFTYNYPAGWRLASVQSAQLLDKSLYLYTYTFEYNSLFIPTL